MCAYKCWNNVLVTKEYISKLEVLMLVNVLLVLAEGIIVQNVFLL